MGAIVGAVVVAGVAASCVVPLPVAQRSDAPGAAARPPCSSAAVRSCALPFPSDEFTVADATRATGRRLAIPESLLPAAARDPLGPGARESDAFGDADGFSAVGPVVFEVDRAVDPASLPADGGDVLAVFDAATGDRVPVRAGVMTDSLRQGAPNTVVRAWPVTRWEPGRTYVARLTTGLRAYVGEVVRPPGVVDPSPWLATVRADLARIEGDGWDRVLGATRFTARSSGDATRTLDTMAQVARQRPHGVRNLVVSPPTLVPGASAVVSGEVELTDFRGPDGVARTSNPPTPQWERFLLVLPERPAGPDGAPVVVYGHGITVAKETMITVAAPNAAAGMATIGIDIPNHGDRQDEGGYVLDLADPSTFGRLPTMTVQGIVDHVSLVRAVQTSLAGRDLAPWRPDGTHGDGRPDLDTSRLLYEGTSMGGVLGVSVTALLPELQGSYLQVAGVGIADIILNSVIWPLFANSVPVGVTAGDSAALQSAATMLLDPADGANFADRLRERRTPLFVQYGVNDGIVPNVTTDRLISLLGLPLVGERIAAPTVPVTGSPGAAVPADGRGAVQVWNGSVAMDAQWFGAHISFVEPQALAVLEGWLAGRRAAMGLPAA